MLLSGGDPVRLPPFSSPNVRYFYFARNAVWLTVKMLGLDWRRGADARPTTTAWRWRRWWTRAPRRASTGWAARWDVDVEDVAKRIGPKTKALYLIHYAGFPGPTEAMRQLADEHGLPLIEDCALSLLSSDGSRRWAPRATWASSVSTRRCRCPMAGRWSSTARGSTACPSLPTPPLASTLSHTVSALLQNLELRGGRSGRACAACVRGGHGHGEGGGHRAGGHGHPALRPAARGPGDEPADEADRPGAGPGGIVEARRRNYFFLLGRLRDVSPPLFNQLPAGVCPLFYPLVVEDKAGCWRGCARGASSHRLLGRFHPACDPSAFPEVAQLRRTILEIPCHQDLTPEVMAQVAHAVREALKRSAGTRKQRGLSFQEQLQIQWRRTVSASRKQGRGDRGWSSRSAGGSGWTAPWAVLAACRGCAAEWDALLDASNAGPFNAWEWLYPWCRRIGRTGGRWCCTARDRTGTLVGLLPLGWSTAG